MKWHLFLREQHLWPLRVDDVPTELHGTGYAYSPLLTLEAAIPANGVLFYLIFLPRGNKNAVHVFTDANQTEPISRQLWPFAPFYKQEQKIWSET